jgi:chromosome segregation ATPase
MSHSRSSSGSDTGGPDHETQDGSTLESSEQIECYCFENENEHLSSLEHLRATLKSALEELELARSKSLEIERETEVITERAISLRDEADLAASKAENAKSRFEKLSNEELNVEELLLKAKDSLSRAQENYRCAQKSLVDAPEEKSKDQLVVDPEKDIVDNKQEEDFSIKDCVSGSIPPFLADSSEMVNIRGKIQEEKEQESLGLLGEEGNLIAYEAEVKGCEMSLAQYEMDLQRIKASKSELQKEVLAMLEAAKQARESAMEADYEVAKVMSLAEQAVALEVDATQRVSVAEIALQKAEKLVLCETVPNHSTSTSSRISENDSDGVSSRTAAYGTAAEGIHLDNTTKEDDSSELHTAQDGKLLISISDEAVEVTDKASGRGPEAARVEVGMLLQETESEKPKNVHHEKDNVKESSSHVGIPKSKRSSRFFSASFFSFNDDESEFTPSNLFSGIQQHFLKISVGILLLCGGYACNI